MSEKNEAPVVVRATNRQGWSRDIECRTVRDLADALGTSLADKTTLGITVSAKAGRKMIVVLAHRPDDSAGAAGGKS